MKELLDFLDYVKKAEVCKENLKDEKYRLFFRTYKSQENRYFYADIEYYNVELAYSISRFISRVGNCFWGNYLLSKLDSNYNYKDYFNRYDYYSFEFNIDELVDYIDNSSYSFQISVDFFVRESQELWVLNN